MWTIVWNMMVVIPWIVIPWIIVPWTVVPWIVVPRVIVPWVVIPWVVPTIINSYSSAEANINTPAVWGIVKKYQLCRWIWSK